MKRSLKLLVAAALLLVPGAWLLHSSFCTTWKFGVPEREYPAVFKELRIIKHDREHSWLTPVRVGDSTIEVEHLTVADAEDHARLGLPEGDYLFFSVDLRALEVEAVTVSHAYAGVLLEEAGTFLFRSNPNPAGPWVVEKLTSAAIPEPQPHGYVKVYRVPKGARVSGLVPKSMWFNDRIRETIRIEDRGGKVDELAFELEWHESSTIWWQMLTVT